MTTDANTPAWIAQIFDAARPALAAEGDLAIVLWIPGATPRLHKGYRPTAETRADSPISALLRPYFATVAKLAPGCVNGYVVAHRGNRLTIFVGPNNTIASQDA